MAWYVYKSLDGFGQPIDVEVPAKKDDFRVTTGGGSSSTPIDLDRIPRVFRQMKTHKGGIGDINNVCGMVVVKQRFKDLVEQFEPGIHLFLPIKILRKNGDEIEGPWYYFTTQQDIDCMLVDHEKGEHFIHAVNGHWRSTMGGITPTGKRKLLLSRPQIVGRHLWTGGLLAYDQLFFSDEFTAAFRKQRFTSVLQPYRRSDEEVDRQWIAEEQMGAMLPQWERFEASGRTDRSAW